MHNKLQMNRSDVGIAIGKWSCGAFAGDPEWLAASQIIRWLTWIPVLLKFAFARFVKLETVFCAQLLMNYFKSG